MDIKEDYGVVKNDLPIMTCLDCKTSNIHNFGSCLCPESKYWGRVPSSPSVDAKGHKATRADGNEYAHICVPYIMSDWKQFDKATMIEIGAEGSSPLLTDDAVLVCQYSGIISVKEVAEPESSIQKILPLESEWLKNKQKDFQSYVTMDDLDLLGWEKIQDYYVDASTNERSDWITTHQKDGSFKPDPEIASHFRPLDQQDVVNLNRILTYYGITTYIRICSFLAQITHECYMLSGKLNTASSIRLKWVFYNAGKRGKAHCLRAFQHVILCERTIMHIT